MLSRLVRSITLKSPQAQVLTEAIIYSHYIQRTHTHITQEWRCRYNSHNHRHPTRLRQIHPNALLCKPKSTIYTSVVAANPTHLQGFVEKLFGLVDLAGQIRTTASVRVVEQHELSVVLAHFFLGQGSLSAAKSVSRM